MKKYTLSELTKEVTGSSEDDYYWESKKESIRNIQRALNNIFGKYEITDSNKNQYIKIYKLMYNDDNIKSLMNKQARISKKIERKEKTLIIPTEFKNKKINEKILTVQSDKYNFTKEEQIVILKTLLEFFREEKSELEYMLEGMIIELKSEEYNQLLDELEKEVKRINISIQGYPYEERVEKMKEIKDYLKSQRLEIDKTIIDNLIIP
ncbi:TPA: hypothetical protein LR945_002527 [Clostridioides difficile]|nr:hypothetical protein [Clostridioides difficile]HBF4815710.1 hypothetical protein [Clostridioides difficile]HBL6721053.1 hypothetical protein [Clostridioides difficile]